MNLSEAQKRVIQNKIAHGFEVGDLDKEFLYLYGEVGEAYSAYIKHLPKDDLGSELADIAIYLLGIAEMTKIDLEAEIIKKMEINEKRVYKTLPNGEIVKIEPK